MTHTLWWLVEWALVTLLALDLTGMVVWAGLDLYRATHPPRGLSREAWMQVRSLIKRDGVGTLHPSLWRAEIVLLVQRAGARVEVVSDVWDGLHYRCVLTPVPRVVRALHVATREPRVATMHSVMAKRRALFGNGVAHGRGA